MDAVDSTDTNPLAPPSLPEPKGAQRLSPKYPVWIDPKEKAVLVDGQICLREGMLEMFACIRNTKEHEAIVSADTKAYLVHAGLLRLGVDTHLITAHYALPMQTARAQDWVKDIRTQKSMTHPFVFAGSNFWTDPETKKQYYQAEGGDFVCVSNFGTAMLDIPVESTQSNEGLEFEAFTEKIPPLGAPVRLVFKPKLKEQGARSQPKSARGGAKYEASNAKSRAK